MTKAVQAELELPVTIGEMVNQLEREILSRRRLHTLRINTGRMTSARAARWLRTAEATLSLLAHIREHDAIPPGLR